MQLLRRWLGMLLCALTGTAALAQGANVSETVLKSALFFKLPQFVYRADDNPAQPLAVCLLGGAAYQPAFEKLSKTPIDTRPVKFNRLNALPDGRQCDFLFIPNGDLPQLEAGLRKLAQVPVVSVSDIPGFAKAGGMVELSLTAPGTPVAILINRKAARVHNIEFNAQLLRLAKVIDP